MGTRSELLKKQEKKKQPRNIPERGGGGGPGGEEFFPTLSHKQSWPCWNSNETTKAKNIVVPAGASALLRGKKCLVFGTNTSAKVCLRTYLHR